MERRDQRRGEDGATAKFESLVADGTTPTSVTATQEANPPAEGWQQGKRYIRSHNEHV